jgi:hypothetical protein
MNDDVNSDTLMYTWYGAVERPTGSCVSVTAEIDDIARLDSDCDIGRLASRMVLVLLQPLLTRVLERQTDATKAATMPAWSIQTRSHPSLTIIRKPCCDKQTKLTVSDIRL